MYEQKYEIDDIDLINWIKENEDAISECNFDFDLIVNAYIDVKFIDYEVIDYEENYKRREFDIDDEDYAEINKLVVLLKNTEKYNL